jgi:hypothetical protein
VNRDPNVAGQAYAFMAMTPIPPGRVDEVRAALETFDRRDSPLARLERTHFGRWVIVPDFVHDSEQPREDPLGDPHLVFTACLDGPLDSWLDELAERLAPEADAVWGRSGRALKDHLLAHQVKTGVFVAAYPNATVAKVRQALEQRTRLIDFAVRSQGMPPDELQREFAREFA